MPPKRTPKPAAKTAPKSTQKKKSAAPYSDHPVVAMEAKAIDGLKDQTGKALADWIALVRRSGAPTVKEQAAWLKEKFGLGTQYAAWIVERARRKEGPTETMAYRPDELVAEMFSGPRAVLLPIYEEILKLAFRLGKDITITPCTTMVPIRRRYVIAQIKPTTQTRIDLGFALKDLKPTGRLIDTGGFAKGDRISHRIPLTKRSEVDAEVKKWLKLAYDMDAPK